MQVRKQQLEPDMEQQTGFKLEKEYIKAVFCHPAYLTSMQRTSCEMPGWDEGQVGIKIAGRNINNLRYADNTILMTEIKEELKSFLMKVKEESEKAGLKLNIQSGPITSWQIDGETIETVIDFIFGGSNITADGDCNYELKDACFLEEKLDQCRDSILKSSDITFLQGSI